jgi:hypothetical protein
MIDELKERLRILDNDEDSLLQNIILQGYEELNALMGVELDYEKKGPARSILLEYCRYVYNNATEYFEENFHKEILRLQLSVAVIENDGQETENATTQ